MLGVTIANDLSASSHVNRILSACSGSLHALRVLRAHGLPPTALHEVACATTISRLLYASPARWGFTTASNRQNLQRFLNRAKGLGYLPPQHQDLDRMMEEADVKLCLLYTS